MKLSKTPFLKVLTIKKCDTSELIWISCHCCFSWVLKINSKSTNSWAFFGDLKDDAPIFLSLLSFLRIVVYVLMKRHHMAKFTPTLYVILVFGNMFTTFLISYRISLLFEGILQSLNSFLFYRVFLNNHVTSC